MSTHEHFTQESVNSILQGVLEDSKTGSMYAPLYKRIRIYIDDDIPKQAREGMTANGHAPMCASSTNMELCIDRKYLYETLNELTDAFIKDNIKNVGTSQMTSSLYENINNILVHELTHLLCQHSLQGARKFKKFINSDGEGQVPKREYTAWMAACEVEANRGYGITKSGCPTYRFAITDRYTYPETQQCKYLEEIYQCILDKYGDELEDDFDEASELAKQMMSQKGNKGDSENGSESRNPDSGDKQEGNGGSEKSQEGGSSESKEGDGENDSERDSNSEGGKALADKDERQRRIEQLARMMCDQSQQMTDEQFDPQMEAQSSILQAVDRTDGAEGYEGGINSNNTEVANDVSGKTMEEVADEMKKEYCAENVAKAMNKMKGIVKGTVCKERVDTYSRQSRKFTEGGLIKKGTKRGKTSAPRILVALDKSGSMNGTTTRQATEAIAKIFEITGRPTSGCYICMHDGDTKGLAPFKKWKDVVKSFYPSGGNSFDRVVKLANKLDVDIVLNIGDGGDYLIRDRDELEKFKDAGRRWIDVNIASKPIRLIYEFAKGCLCSDYARTGFLREWVDMTGAVVLADKDIVDIAKREFGAK